jgi:hypothetical protein
VIVGIVIGALAAILLVLAALFLFLRARVRRRPSARSLKHLEAGIAHDAHDLSAIPSQQLVVNPFLDPRPGVSYAPAASANPFADPYVAQYVTQ